MWRKPLSQIFGKAKIGVLAISARMKSPSSPSIVLQIVS